MRPQFAQLVTDMEQNSFDVSNARADLADAIEKAKNNAFYDRFNEQKQSLIYDGRKKFDFA